MHGFGVFIWKEGNKYEGNWEKGKQNGKGKYISKSKNVIEGYWKDGIIIR